jgi:SpoVK/Ycf46/Vps4 family AAA+-type ATPase
MLSTIAKTSLTMPRERVISGDSHGEEENVFNYSLRPQRFAQYIGQPTLIRRLKIAVDAATGRKEPVEHVLLHGPPGLGKTTLAHVIANEGNGEQRAPTRYHRRRPQPASRDHLPLPAMPPPCPTHLPNCVSPHGNRQYDQHDHLL